MSLVIILLILRCKSCRRPKVKKIRFPHFFPPNDGTQNGVWLRVVQSFWCPFLIINQDFHTSIHHSKICVQLGSLTPYLYSLACQVCHWKWRLDWSLESWALLPVRMRFQKPPPESTSLYRFTMCIVLHSKKLESSIRLSSHVYLCTDNIGWTLVWFAKGKGNLDPYMCLARLVELWFLDPILDWT